MENIKIGDGSVANMMVGDMGVKQIYVGDSPIYERPGSYLFLELIDIQEDQMNG